MSILKRKNINYVIGLILFISIVTSLNIAWRRIKFEKQNKVAEIMLSFNEIGRLASLGGVSIEDLLRRLSQEKRITSVALEEDTLTDFVESGKVTVLKGSEIINLYRIGHVNRFILTDLYKYVTPSPEKFYMFVQEPADFERIKDFYTVEFGSDNVRVIGRRNILEILDEKEDLYEVGLGISPDKIRLLQKFGLYAVLRFRNSSRLSSETISRKFLNLPEKLSVNSVIFEGDAVLGYPDQIQTIKRKLKDYNYNFGHIEFTHQKGATQLALSMQNSVLRVHSINEKQMKQISPENAAKRYVRATKERGVKLLLVHPFLSPEYNDNIIDLNMAYLGMIHSGLEKFGFKIEPIKDLNFEGFKPVNSIELFLIGLSVMLVFILLIHSFIPITQFQEILLFSFFIILFYVLQLFGSIQIWSYFIALLTAITFPTYALITSFPVHSGSVKSIKRFSQTLFYVLKSVVITLTGALFIVGILFRLDFLFNIHRFSGVKLSFIIPLILIAIYFFLRPHRMTSIFYVFKRIFYAPIRTSSLLAVMFTMLFMFIYLLRSGNYISFQIPMVEQFMRTSLEDFLFVRPRTKEFFIGYPFLIFAFYYIDRRISRNWLWFFNMLGVVALISLINSFCHLHTPILISLYRSGLGLLLGIGIATFGILILKMMSILFKSKNV